ncbi:hypothetical protein AGROH133_06159 [Agrobacterium tumefaciens]|nr:hypothetical protein AGROH133_06159 [Agrobacterium tumefaciens]
MQNVLHERLDRGSAVTVMPCNYVVYRIGFPVSSFWAHVLILLFQSRKTSLVMKKARAPAP